MPHASEALRGSVTTNTGGTGVDSRHHEQRRKGSSARVTAGCDTPKGESHEAVGFLIGSTTAAALLILSGLVAHAASTQPDSGSSKEWRRSLPPVLRIVS
jgi:hypothetical protein